MRRRLWAALGLTCALGALFGLYQKTRSLNPEDHARVDSALRELRSLDRTINQDVLRARYQLIGSYDPVRRSYRRIEELEAALASPPRYLDERTRASLSRAVTAYRASVTAKQTLIEDFKYRSADLKELLGYLPGAGTGVAKAASENGDERVAADVNRVLQETLLYNLTSDETYAPIITREVESLLDRGEHTRSSALKRRVRTLVLNIRALLKVKPVVDRLLVRIFDEPVSQHEEQVAHIYYAGYTAAEHLAGRYRMGLYGLVVALLGLVAWGVRRLQHSAADLRVANEKLEERVAERTRELDARNREMRVVLDNVDQALFTVDLDGTISRERSAALDWFLPSAVPGASFGEVVGAVDGKAGGWITLGWDQLRDGFLPTEVVLDQLPRSLTFKNRHYGLAYRPIASEGLLEKVLLIMSDVTDAVERSRREADQQEQLVVFQQLMKDRSGFLEFFGEAERLVERAVAASTDLPTLIRDIHTLKGNCAIFGVSSLSTVCHGLEAKLIETGEPLALEENGRLQLAWGHFAGRVKVLVGEASDERVELSRADLRLLGQSISEGKPASELLRLLRHLEREPVERRLTRLSEQARALARRLGKGDVVVSVEPHEVRLDRKRWAPFWSTFVHMVRNALDHGLERPEEREACGKSPTGHLVLRARQMSETLVSVEIADDGRGIDWESVRRKGAAFGLPTTSEDELLEILFHGGVSTKDIATETSGRGAGVSACYNACLALGGTLTVQTSQGTGTTFRFTIPADDAANAPLSSAA